jgi:hypothetical protein
LILLGGNARCVTIDLLVEHGVWIPWDFSKIKNEMLPFMYWWVALQSDQESILSQGSLY